MLLYLYIPVLRHSLPPGQAPVAERCRGGSTVILSLVTALGARLLHRV
jgi:hypothetical protein